MFFLLLLFILPFVSNNKKPFISIFILLAILIYYGMGIGNGSDWINYYKYFDCKIYSNCGNDYLEFEPGYELITLTFGEAGFFYIHAVIFFINFYCLYYFSSFFKKPYLIIFTVISFYGWILYTEQIRQALSLSLFLLSTTLFLKRNNIASAFLIIIACLFHTTAAIGFIIFSTKFLSKNKIILLISTLLLFYFLYPSLFLDSIIIFSGENSSIYQKLNFYLSNEESTPGNYLGLGSFIDIGFLIIFLINRKSLNKSSKSLKNIDFIIIMYFIFIIASKFQPVIYRLSYYFLPFFAIFLHDLFLNKKFITKIIIVLMLFLQSYRPFLHEAANFHLKNYESVLFNNLLVDDIYLRTLSQIKCLQLESLGYGSLCS